MVIIVMFVVSGVALFMLGVVAICVVMYRRSPESPSRVWWLVPVYGVMAAIVWIGILLQNPWIVACGVLSALLFSVAILIERALPRYYERQVATGKLPAAECPNAPARGYGAHELDPDAVTRSQQENQPHFQCRRCQAPLSLEWVHDRYHRMWKGMMVIDSLMIVVLGIIGLMGLLYGVTFLIVLACIFVVPALVQMTAALGIRRFCKRLVPHMAPT